MDLYAEKQAAKSAYNAARSEYKKIAGKAMILEDFQKLKYTPEFRKLREAERKCKLLGVII